MLKWLQYCDNIVNTIFRCHNEDHVGCPFCPPESGKGLQMHEHRQYQGGKSYMTGNCIGLLASCTISEIIDFAFTVFKQPADSQQMCTTYIDNVNEISNTGKNTHYPVFYRNYDIVTYYSNQSTEEFSQRCTYWSNNII